MHAIIHIFTYKTGLLARVAHDLQLTAERHEFTLQCRQLRGSCAADSLRVDGAVTSHGLDPNTLSAKDKQQVIETVRSEILQSARFPSIELDAEVLGDATAGKLQVRGTLRLRAQERPVSADVLHHGDHLHAAFELTPSQFGIAPYKALAGAIKLQDRVRVTVDVALEGHKLDALLASSDPLKLEAATSR
jgi:hypothetical protein